MIQERDLSCEQVHSRPFLVQLLSKGEIKFTKVGLIIDLSSATCSNTSNDVIDRCSTRSTNSPARHRKRG